MRTQQPAQQRPMAPCALHGPAPGTGRPRACRGPARAGALGAPQRTFELRAPRRARAPRGPVSTVCRAAGERPFPFVKEQYMKCVLQVASKVQDVPDGQLPIGNLIFMREEDVRQGADGRFVRERQSAFLDGKALVMSVGGDTLTCILSLLEGEATTTRPLALDLLWSILERGQAVARREWRLLHVAVVALEGMVFTARLFFGDPDTGRVAWDCDCRPSDACWLALKMKCPIYVNSAVWHEHAQSWRELIRPEATNAELALVRPSDPEPVKLLKREMEVAILEEDYGTAARIRDHPYMMLFRRIADHEQNGRSDAALYLREQLEELIQDANRAALDRYAEP